MPSESAFIASLTDEDLAWLLGGQPNMGVANTQGFGNIPAYGVSWGYGEVAAMEQAGATAIAHSMDEMVALLNQ